MGVRTIDWSLGFGAIFGALHFGLEGSGLVVRLGLEGLGLESFWLKVQGLLSYRV